MHHNTKNGQFSYISVCARQGEREKLRARKKEHIQPDEFIFCQQIIQHKQYLFAFCAMEKYELLKQTLMLYVCLGVYESVGVVRCNFLVKQRGKM